MGQSKVSGHNDVNLHMYDWKIAHPKADILFVHGLFEHSGRYESEAQFFNEAGYNFYAYDQRTHGQSEGKHRSYIDDFSAYVRDYQFLVKRLELGKNRPYYLFSHSMGGLVLTSYLLENRSLGDAFKGAVLSAPLLMPDSNTAPLLQKMAGVVGTLFPKLKTIQIDSQAISRDPIEVEKYISDPLNYTDKMYAATGYQLIKQMKKIRPQLSSFHHPFLVLHGTDDKLSEITGSKLLYDNASSGDKEMVELKNYKHEILKDIGKEKVLNKIVAWMNERVS